MVFGWRTVEKARVCLRAQATGSSVFCCPMAEGTESSSEDLGDPVKAKLPRRFSGQSSVDLEFTLSESGFLVDSWRDTDELMNKHSTGSTLSLQTGREFWACAQSVAAGVCKRRACMGPTWQRVLLARMQLPLPFHFSPRLGRCIVLAAANIRCPLQQAIAEVIVWF